MSKKIDLTFYNDGYQDGIREKKWKAEYYLVSWGKNAASDYARGYADGEKEAERLQRA